MTDTSNHLFIALPFTLKVNYDTKRKSFGESALLSLLLLNTTILLFFYSVFILILFTRTESEILFHLEMIG